jgi:hypothetical protein
VNCKLVNASVRKGTVCRLVLGSTCLLAFSFVQFVTVPSRLYFDLKMLSTRIQ